MPSMQSIDDSMVISAQAVHIGAGNARKTLEDSAEATVVRLSDGALLHVGIVADGMGGIEGGEVASRLAVETILDTLAAGKLLALPLLLKVALQDAHDRVVQKRRELGFDHMGTTATLVAITLNNRLYLAHVGDSRAYLIRNHEIFQLTQDHSWGLEMLRAGRLTAEEVAVHERRDLLARYLGSPMGVDVDLGLRISPDQDDQEAYANQGFQLLPGDRVLLCSDGLIKNRRRTLEHYVEEHEIISIADQYDPNEAAKVLINLALERQVDDNVSVVILEVNDRPRVEAPDAPTVVGRSTAAGRLETRVPAPEPVLDPFIPPAVPAPSRPPAARPTREAAALPNSKVKTTKPLLTLFLVSVAVVGAVLIGIFVMTWLGVSPFGAVTNQVRVVEVVGRAEVDPANGEPYLASSGSVIRVRSKFHSIVVGQGSRVALSTTIEGADAILYLSENSMLWIDPDKHELFFFRNGQMLVYLPEGGPVTLPVGDNYRVTLYGSLIGVKYTPGEAGGVPFLTIHCLQGPCEVGGVSLQSCERTTRLADGALELPSALVGIEWMALVGDALQSQMFCPPD